MLRPLRGRDGEIPGEASEGCCSQQRLALMSLWGGAQLLWLYFGIRDPELQAAAGLIYTNQLIIPTPSVLSPGSSLRGRGWLRKASRGRRVGTGLCLGMTPATGHDGDLRGRGPLSLPLPSRFQAGVLHERPGRRDCRRVTSAVMLLGSSPSPLSARGGRADGWRRCWCRAKGSAAGPRGPERCIR